MGWLAAVVCTGLGVSATGAELTLRRPVAHEVVQRVGYEPREAHAHGRAADGSPGPRRGYADVPIAWEAVEGAGEAAVEARLEWASIPSLID